MKESMVTAERNQKNVTRNISFFKKIEGKIECDESEEEEDENHQNESQNVNFPYEQQFSVQIEPEENQPGYLEQEGPDDVRQL
jgi:hypothetical protein